MPPLLPEQRDELRPFFELVRREVERQRAKYGPFSDGVGGMRLAVAVLEDEVAEVRDAWRSERRASHWGATHSEALQVAAVAVRLLVDTGLAPDFGDSL